MGLHATKMANFREISKRRYKKKINYSFVTIAYEISLDRSMPNGNQHIINIISIIVVLY